MQKRRYKKKALSIRIGEAPTKERSQHQGGIVVEAAESTPNGQPITLRHRAIAECVLDSYYIRELISDPEYMAGMRFRKAYLRAILRVKVEDVGGGAHADPEMAMLTPLYSEQLLREAYSVLDMTEKSVIITVCGHDDWVGGAYRMAALHAGLQKLIELWKLL